MEGIALYSPYKRFPAELLHKTDVPLSIKTAQDASTGMQQYILGLDQYTVILNLMPEPQMPEHLAGFAAYIDAIYHGKPDKRASQIIDQIKRTRTVIGVLIEPDDLDAELPLGIIGAVAEMSKSILFINGTLLDYNDNVILAPNGSFDRKARIDPTAPPKPWWRFW